jgi:hypothetical protein
MIRLSAGRTMSTTPDARMLFPSGVEFIGNGVGLPGGMTVICEGDHFSAGAAL